MRINRHCFFWWSPRRRVIDRVLCTENVGDILGPRLAIKILNEAGINYTNYCKGRLLSTGSIIHFAQQGDTLWGSGVNGKIDFDYSSLRNFDLNIKSVRGPITRKILTSAGLTIPEVYGDPGLLVSKYWPTTRKSTTKKNIIFIPHINERCKNSHSKHVELLSPTTNIERFIKKIQSARKVISSSLHGIIIAESYGIPAFLLAEKSGETTLKYQDYYLGTGRELPIISDNINQALDLPEKYFDPRSAQERILKAFPYELWAEQL